MSDFNDLPWPKKGDALFSKDLTDFNTTACFFKMSSTLYATGYKRAADILVDTLRKQGCGQDFLVYPIIFMYRQYLELQLKEIIAYGRQLVDDLSDIPTHHDLGLLWREAREHIKNRWPDQPEDDLNIVGACIKEFSAADPLSTAFRYPADKRGNSSIKDMQHNLDVGKFSDVMGRISSLLEGSSDGILNNLEIKRDMAQSFESEQSYE